jgi:hypothetical protein
VLSKIVSGGQTGVDRAALACGLEFGIAIGGYCPAGYRAEDGTIPERFRPFLTCTEGPDYRDRTRLNAATSDATLIVARGTVMAGTGLTRSLCRRLGKPNAVVQVGGAGAAEEAIRWLAAVEPGILNVAGPREGTHPGIEEQAHALLVEVIGALRARGMA